MKKFIRRGLVFIIASLSLLFLLDVVVSSQLKNSSNRVYASWYDLMQGNIDSDIIILGSSRAWVQYSPSILDSALHCNTYNLGIDGSCLNRQITKYEIFRHHNVPPRWILLNIDFFSFGFTRGYESYQYFPYFYDRDIRRLVFPQEQFSWAERWIPFYRYTHLGLNNIPYDDRSLVKGFHSVNRPWNGTKMSENPPINLDLDERTLQMFRAFLNRAQEEKIKVILVYAPVYFKAKDLLLNNYQFEKCLESIRKEFSLPILRYDDSPICRDTTFFYNATHLNSEGAELFSRQLSQDILRLERELNTL